MIKLSPSVADILAVPLAGDTTFVYLFKVRQAEGVLYKIGVSSSPYSRAKYAYLQEWETEISACAMLQSRQEAETFESELHDAFKRQRVNEHRSPIPVPGINGRTEWFSLDTGQARLLALCFGLITWRFRRD